SPDTGNAKQSLQSFLIMIVPSTLNKSILAAQNDTIYSRKRPNCNIQSPTCSLKILLLTLLTSYFPMTPSLYRTHLHHIGAASHGNRHACCHDNPISLLHQTMLFKMVFHSANAFISIKNFINFIRTYAPNQSQLLAHLFAFGKRDDRHTGPEFGNAPSRTPRVSDRANHFGLDIIGQCYASISQ